MSDSAINSNIFGENFSSFINTLEQFKSVDKLTAPAREHNYRENRIYTAITHTINSEKIFPVFTDINAIEPPLLKKTPLDFLNMIFCNPAIQTTLINPPAKQATLPENDALKNALDSARSDRLDIITGNTIKLNRNKLSIIIGSLESDIKNNDTDDFIAKILDKMNHGKLHSANYISSLAIAQGKAHQIATIYPQLLINLRLYQDAYDFIKIFPENPVMLYYSAIIFRITGNFKKTLEILNSITENPAMKNKKNLQKAWMAMSLNNFKEAEEKFKELLNSPLEKNEASIGLGMTLSKKGLLKKDIQALNDSLNILKKSLEIPCELNAQAHFYIGNIYFNTAKYPESIEHYAKSLKLNSSLPTMINMTNAYLKLEKYEETLNRTLLIALTNLNSAEKILSEFPKNILSRLNTVHPDISTAQNISQHANISEPKQKEKLPENHTSKEVFIHEIPQPARPETISSPSSNTKENQNESINTASLEPNKPIAQSDRIKSDEKNPPKNNDTAFKPDSSLNIFNSNIQTSRQTGNETDEFVTRAFKLASQLEDELGKKIHFNIDGINDIEKKLRISFIGNLNQQQKLELILDCSAFLCYMLKEKHKGNLIKFSNFDQWAWPMLFENSSLVTYPIERLWRLIWVKEIPDAGWLAKYVQYLDEIFQTSDIDSYCGINAIKHKLRSHPEKIIDAQTEHKKMMILNSSLEETRAIKINRAGISEIENAIKFKFKPQVPPSSEGWKLLRCYAHTFIEILIQELQFQWFNTDGNDGQWSMNSPHMTFIFPFGKIYKCAANGESLTEYFEYLLEEKEQRT